MKHPITDWKGVSFLTIKHPITYWKGVSFPRIKHPIPDWKGFIVIKNIEIFCDFAFKYYLLSNSIIYYPNVMDDLVWITVWAMKHNGYKRTVEITQDIKNGYEIVRLSSFEFNNGIWVPPHNPRYVHFFYTKTKTMRAKSKTPLFTTFFCQCKDGACFLHQLKKLYQMKSNTYGIIQPNMPLFQFSNKSIITASKLNKELTRVKIIKITRQCNSS